ncbi:unnamed protein product [Clonostachys rosea f. rosea IK726]|uniref:Uncharacterized protein n=2 Tax=Bionectria ochroleuca TaxID=29856 RepID=A0A0B7K575_BIOOC|nr:unnamed protein product [Clonostachys rosea f. rosea IK726]
MTQTVLPSAAAPPVYDAASGVPDVAEKQQICPRHGASTTPTIDKHLRQFHVNDRLQALAPGTTALDGQGCTRCTVEAVTSVLSGYTRDLKAAKKSGQLTKQERKAMKAEAKAMSKEIKKDLKATWKKAA